MNTVLIVLAIAVTIAVVTAFVFTYRHPENAASHQQPHDRTSTSERLYGGASRPAGPDAETMAPDQLGGDHRPPR
jgi:hypothetical protein